MRSVSSRCLSCGLSGWVGLAGLLGLPAALPFAASYMRLWKSVSALQWQLQCPIRGIDAPGGHCRSLHPIIAEPLACLRPVSDLPATRQRPASDIDLKNDILALPSRIFFHPPNPRKQLRPDVWRYDTLIAPCLERFDLISIHLTLSPKRNPLMGLFTELCRSQP
jgi:hypothetical protein